MGNVLVIYHKNCNDGFTSAWVVKNNLSLFPGERLSFFASDYNSAPPDVKGKRVYILDFSYPREVLDKLADAADEITIIDHHESSKYLQAYKHHKVKAIHSNDHSGARLTWDYVTNKKAVPLLVAYVEDRDLWTFTLPHSKEINAYLQTFNGDSESFDLWDEYNKLINTTRGYSDFVSNGSVLLDNINVITKKAKKEATLVSLGSYKVPTYNSQLYQSDIGGELAKGNPFSIIYSHHLNEKGKSVFRYSLRSEKEGGEDVSKIAKEYGGGGHKNAAGFTSEDLVFKGIK